MFWLKLLLYWSYLEVWFEDWVFTNLFISSSTISQYLFFADFTTIISLKLTLCLMFLIVIRGCIPRYRYDFLTKMGWVKFLGHVLAFFVLSITFYLVW